MLSVGIIGLGTIGNVVAKALDEGINGMSLWQLRLADATRHLPALPACHHRLN